VAEIWVGDLVRAWEAVDARTPEKRTAVARLLGLDEVAVRPDRAESATEDRPHEMEARPIPEAPVTPEPVDPAEPGDETQSDAVPDQPLEGNDVVRLIGVEPVAVLGGGPTLPRAGDTGSHRRHLPLINPRLTRSVLQELLSQETEEGLIDVAALVERAAKLSLRHVPRRATRTLRFGVQVLSDEGAGMAPFVRDQEHLIRQVRHLVGDAATVAYFADAPGRGAGSGPVWTWSAYEPPPSGSRILLLSHLGIGGPWPDPARAGRSEWEQFAELVRWHGCRVIVLVPYPIARVPAWAFRLFAVASWDRSLTSARAARVRP
jgi:hypothetical protein